MHGRTMGALSVEATVDGKSWKSVWIKSGQQQSRQGEAWRASGKVGLPSGAVSVRLKGAAGSSYTGDMVSKRKPHLQLRPRSSIF